ncbi:MAG TPA: hypothetical protein VGD08_02505 [Stellaceae bacterium]|jgi:hypothetical protein
MTDDAPRCGRCRFWYDNGLSDHWRLCRRQPPRSDARGDPEWPRTHIDHWCGEFLSLSGVSFREMVTGRQPGRRGKAAESSGRG